MPPQTLQRVSAPRKFVRIALGRGSDGGFRESCFRPAIRERPLLPRKKATVYTFFVSKRRAKKELQTVQAFEKALGEEISLSSEFDLPMALISAYVEGGWVEDAVRQALNSLRTADLVAQPDLAELLIVLPNTPSGTARVVEERLDRAIPEATLGVEVYTRNDSAEDLLGRARAARKDSGTAP